jgi:hypothetical protein
MQKALLAIVGIACVGAGVWFATREKPPVIEPPKPVEQTPQAAMFENVAARAGITFALFDPATPQHLISETLPGGIAWIDFDKDGWPDLFCVQSALPAPSPPDTKRTHKLYRNNRDGTFTDVTDAVGLNHSGFGMGCAVGDYDNDGFDDLVVTYADRVQLFRNEANPNAPGGRKFDDVTAKAGLANPHFGTSCAWGDLDNDGFLDLYICNYVVIDPAKPVTCRDEAKKLFYPCSPSAYPHTTHVLFRNNGNGTFADVSKASGIGAVPGAPGLGVVICDFDGDGKQDIYVANDMNPAYLFKNKGNMQFEEAGLYAGVALGPGGDRIAGMGIAVGDFSGNSRPSLFITNFQRSPNVLFQNRGNWLFEDMSYNSGLGGPSLSRLGFGTCALDADLDGHLDLAVANGHVTRPAKELYGVPYAQESQLFLGDGKGKFRDVTANAGSDYTKPRVARGLATADFNNDGKPDLAFSAIGEQLTLLQNKNASQHSWITLELVGDGKSVNRNALGSTVTIEYAGHKQTHFLVGGGSYLSANEFRLHIGLATHTTIDKVTVKWTNGNTQTYNNIKTNTHWKLRQSAPDAEAVALPTK